MTVSGTSRRCALAGLGAWLAALLAACAAPPKTVEPGELPFEQAVAQATDALAAQAQSGPAFLAKVSKKSVVLGRTAEAEQAFARVVALGIAYNELGVKFLFNPGSTDDALSPNRANFIRQRLVAEASSLGPKTKTSGMGFRQNIVGSGTDNAVDALDRRVEFKIVPCP